MTSQAVVIGVSCRLVRCFKVGLIYSWLSCVVMNVNAYHYYFQIPVNNIIQTRCKVAALVWIVSNELDSD